MHRFGRSVKLRDRVGSVRQPVFRCPWRLLTAACVRCLSAGDGGQHGEHGSLPPAAPGTALPRSAPELGAHSLPLGPIGVLYLKARQRFFAEQLGHHRMPAAHQAVMEGRRILPPGCRPRVGAELVAEIEFEGLLLGGHEGLMAWRNAASIA